MKQISRVLISSVLIMVMPFCEAIAQTIVENPSYQIQHHILGSKKEISKESIPTIISIERSEKSLIVELEKSVNIPKGAQSTRINISDQTDIWYMDEEKFVSNRIIMAEGIAVNPGIDTYFRDTIIRFKLHFKAIPEDVTRIDLIESAKSPWNYANINLSESHATGENTVSHFNPEEIFEEPLFNGRDPHKSFTQWMHAKIEYPQNALNFDVTGKVILKFIVRKDGSLTFKECKLIEAEMDAISNTLRQDVYKAFCKSPEWTPAKIHGVPVDVSYTFPIIFMIRANYPTR